MDTQPATESDVKLPNIKASSTWQSMVFSSSLQPDESQPTAENRTPATAFARFDRAHQTLPDSRLPSHWTVDIGWHRKPEQPPPSEKQSEKKQSDLPANRLNRLLAEAAHDVRSPIAVAQQILSAVTARVREEGQLGNGDVDLLDVARLRLLQADRWAEGILVDHSLETGCAVNIRKRFYPHQWRLGLEPLLNSLAGQQRVQLNWTGWDRSLPRLYLDANHLSRAVLNLVANAIAASQPGSDVRIRVAWQTNIAQQLVLSIEDAGRGLEVELMRKINAIGLWPMRHGESDLDGIGLKTAKSLIVGMRGSISVQRAAGSGTLFRLALPVDNFHSQIRSWLLANAQVASAHRNSGRKSIEIHAIRSTADNLELVDRLLQQSAQASDFVYRITKDRWLWISLASTNSHGGEPSDSAVNQAIRSVQKFCGTQGKRAVCQQQSVFRLGDVSFPDWQGASQTGLRIPALTSMIAEKFAELMGDHVPLIDELENSSPFVFRPQHRKQPRHLRQDRPEAAQTRLNQTRSNQNSASMLADTPTESFSGKLAELAQQWHAAGPTV